MKCFNLISLVITILLMVSCGVQQRIVEVPVESQTEVRDSLVYIRDTVRVDIPVEVTKVVLPAVDTSRISTSFAESTAYLDTLQRKIHHTLQQKGHIYKPIDTVIRVQYITKETQIPVYKHIEVPVTPNWAWYSLLINILGVLMLVAFIVLGIKR